MTSIEGLVWMDAAQRDKSVKSAAANGYGRSAGQREVGSRPRAAPIVRIFSLF